MKRWRCLRSLVAPCLAAFILSLATPAYYADAASPNAPATRRIAGVEIVENSRVMQPTYKDVVVGTVQLDNGDYKELKLNIYKPQNSSGPTPVLVYVFGGAWLRGDYTQSNNKPINWQGPLTLVNKGIAVATIDYRRSHESIFPSQIHDVKGAIRFLRAHAAEYGLDPQRIGVWGNSAGGHLAALAGTSGNRKELEGDVGGNLDFSSSVNAVVAFYPPTDIFNMGGDKRSYVQPAEEAISMHDAPNAAEARLIGFNHDGEGMAVLRAVYENEDIDSPYWAKAKLAEAVSPMTWISKDCPPFFIYNGAYDEAVPWMQSVKLYEALSREHCSAIYMTDSSMGHAAPKSEIVWEAALQFVVAQLTGK